MSMRLDVHVHIDSKPFNISLDERHYLLLISCLKSDCNLVKMCGHLILCLTDFRGIRMNGSDVILPANLTSQKF